MQFWPKSSGCCCGDGECGSLRVVVTLCPLNTPVSGATVTVKDNLGATVGTCTTDGSGICSVPIPAAGTYSVTVAATGRVTTTVTKVATCTENDVPVSLGRVLDLTVKGCTAGLTANTVAGATVTVTLGGSSHAGVTDASGVVKIPVQADGTYAISITEPSGRLTYSSSVAIPCGTTSATINMVAAPGYHCVDWTTAWGCAPFPIADTLFLTDPLYGACTLTWDGAEGLWKGSKVVTVPACPTTGCAAATGIVITYRLEPTSYTYTVDGSGRGALTVFIGETAGCPSNGVTARSSMTKITAVTCPPAAFSATMGDSTFRFPNNIYCSVPHASITITE